MAGHEFGVLGHWFRSSVNDGAAAPLLFTPSDRLPSAAVG